MVSTCKKRQSSKRLFSQLDNFDQNVIIGNAMNNRQENTTVNESTADQDFTVGNTDVGQVVNEHVVNVKRLDRSFSERNDREKVNIVDTVEDKIQNATLRRNW